MPAKTVVKKPAAKTTVKKSPSFLSILGKETEELGAGLLNPSPTSEVKPIKTAFEAAQKKTSEDASKLPVIKQVNEASTDVEKAGETAASIASVAGKLTEPSTWVRVGKVLAGGILIIIGLWMFAKAVAPNTTSAVSSGASKATNAVAPERYMAGQAIRRRAAQTAPRTAAKIATHKTRRTQARTAIRRRERARRP